MWRRAWIWRRRHARRTTYSIQWYGDDGRKRTESVGADRRLAEQTRRERELELNAGLLRQTSRIRLKEFGDEHLRLTAGKCAPKTLKEQREALDRLAEFSRNCQLDKISQRMMEEFVAMRLKEVRPATVNKNLRTLHGLFNRAKERGYLQTNPLEHVKAIREPEKELRVLGMDEIKRILRACPDSIWRTFVFLALTTGLRRGELCALDWEDVDLENAILRVRCKPGAPTKTGRNRMMPLVSAAVEMLKALKQQTPWPYVFQTEWETRFGNNLNRVWARIVRNAGVAHCTLHDLRRTFVSHLAMTGANEAVAQKLAGHTSIQTTVRYYTGVLPEALRRAQALLPYAELATFWQREDVNAETER